MQNRFDEIDALRGFAMFLVVLGHSIIVYPTNLHENILLGNLYEFISTFHLPLFFIVSGYCFSYKSNYGQYIVKKIKRILIPYFVFSLINILLRTLIPTLINQNDSFLNLLKDVFINGGEYWFLYTLFTIFLFYPLLHKINSNKIGVVVLEMLLLVFSLLRININIFCLTPLLKYLFYFNTGVLIKLYNNDIFKRHNYAISSLAFVLLVLCFALYRKFDNSFFETLCALLGIALSYLLSCFKWFTDIFKAFGNNSLQIHLCNGYSLVFSRTLICRITQNPYAIVVFNLSIDFFVVHFVIEYVCKKFKIIKLLMGIN